jgi:hypothetical protein
MLQRFFTDALSNAVVLDDLRVLSGPRAAERLLEDSRPLRMLLHEKTHHSSFDSRVGIALGTLAAFGAYHQIVAPNAGELSANQRDLLLARSVYRLLEPLVEGLALFAEHDSVPDGRAPASSAVTATALRLLFGASRDGTEEHLRGLLWRLRGDADWTAAKTDLLTQPLTARPAYLLGYLAVKGLYWTLVSRCPRFVNPDLFVLLMLDYWFRDSQLARHLERFEPPAPPRATSDELTWVIEHLEDRTALLLRDVNTYLDELIAYLETNPAVTPGGAPNEPSYRHSTPPTAVPLGRMVRQAATKRYSAAAFLDYRNDFRFAASPVAVHISGSGRARLTSPAGSVVAENIPVVRLSTIAGHERVLDGAVEGVMTPHCGGRIVLIISALDGLVSVRDWDSNEWNPADLVEYFDRFPSTLEVLATKKRLQADQSLAAGHPLVARELTSLEKTAGDAALHLYSQWALPNRTSAERSLFTAPLASAGFRGPLSADLCKVMGQVSLRCGCHVWDMHAAIASGWDRAATLVADLEDINQALRPLRGLNAFVIKDGKISSMF